LTTFGCVNCKESQFKREGVNIEKVNCSPLGSDEEIPKTRGNDCIESGVS